MPTKICKQCQQTKPLEDFALCGKGRRRTRCKPCCRILYPSSYYPKHTHRLKTFTPVYSLAEDRIEAYRAEMNRNKPRSVSNKHRNRRAGR